jgi:3-phenylpropionate/trans-cinnamate dioxygenase ferredoxin subunit
VVSEPLSVRVANANDVPDGAMLLVTVAREPILLVNVDGTIRAMQGLCSHEEYELDQGFRLGDTLTCTLHGSRFSLLTGEALDPPAELPLALYPVRIADGGVWLDLPSGEVEVNSELR